MAYRGHTNIPRHLNKHILFVQDVEALKSVQRQLETFKSEMERDGVAQRGECRKVVAGAIRRAQKLVDSTLQVCLTFCWKWLYVSGMAGFYSSSRGSGLSGRH